MRPIMLVAVVLATAVPAALARAAPPPAGEAIPAADGTSTAGDHAGPAGGAAAADAATGGPSLSEGGELYRLYCGPCHDAMARGGGLVLVERNAPSLATVPLVAIPAFARAGPGPMPAFKSYVLSDEQVASIVRYLEFMRSPPHPGGFTLGYLGPVPEGFVSIFIGLGLAVLAAVLIEWKREG